MDIALDYGSRDWGFESLRGRVIFSWLNKRIYSWYVDEDFLLLRYMCHREAFRNDINEKCVLCKTEGNGIEHVTNNWI